MGEITFDKEMKVGQWHSETPDYSAAYSQWLPIDTAPKNKPVDLWVVNSVNGNGFRITDCVFDKYAKEWVKDRRGFSIEYHPTHWMPPPSKPIG